MIFLFFHDPCVDNSKVQCIYKFKKHLTFHIPLTKSISTVNTLKTINFSSHMPIHIPTNPELLTIIYDSSSYTFHCFKTEVHNKFSADFSIFSLNTIILSLQCFTSAFSRSIVQPPGVPLHKWFSISKLSFGHLLWSYSVCSDHKAHKHIMNN